MKKRASSSDTTAAPRKWTTVWKSAEPGIDAELRVLKDFNPGLDAEQIDQLLRAELKHNVPCVVAGRPGLMRRGQAFHGPDSGYAFAGAKVADGPVSASEQVLLDTVNSMLGTQFNGVLHNCYGPGEKLGAHSDSEKGLSDSKVVAWSLGAARRFCVTRKAKGRGRRAQVCEHSTGDMELMLMAGADFQKCFKHEIKAGPGIRHSLTLRCHREAASGKK